MPNQTLRKWGHSTAVRIPTSVLAEVNLSPGAAVEVRAEGGRIVIEPKPPALTLDALLDRINEHNRHAEIDSGSAQGVEAW